MSCVNVKFLLTQMHIIH